ncbi:hypothetical protein SNK04_014137 [Fusarium graminearum]
MTVEKFREEFLPKMTMKTVQNWIARATLPGRSTGFSTCETWPLGGMSSEKAADYSARGECTRHGSSRKRGKKWRAMVRIKPHPTASKTFNGRKAAEDWARITEDALRAGLPPPQEHDARSLD